MVLVHKIGIGRIAHMWTTFASRKDAFLVYCFCTNSFCNNGRILYSNVIEEKCMPIVYDLDRTVGLVVSGRCEKHFIARFVTGLETIVGINLIPSYDFICPATVAEDVIGSFNFRSHVTT